MTVGEKLESPGPRSSWAWTSSRPGFRSPRRATSRRSRRSPGGQGSVICGLARCADERHRPRRRGAEARRAQRIHIFIGTSPSTASTSSSMDRTRSSSGRSRASRGRAATPTTSSSAPRTPPRPSPTSSSACIESAIEAGATTVNIPDTVGYAYAADYAELFARSGTVPNIDRAGHLRPLPRRSRPRRRELAGARSRTAPGRSSAPSTASANGPATARSKRS